MNEYKTTLRGMGVYNYGAIPPSDEDRARFRTVWSKGLGTQKLNRGRDYKDYFIEQEQKQLKRFYAINGFTRNRIQGSSGMDTHS